MKRYFSKRSRGTQDGPSENSVGTPHIGSCSIDQIGNDDVVDLDINQVVSDPGLRKQIVEYDVNLRDQVRREYISKGPCQPRNHVFPRKQYGNERRSFRPSWYDDFDWLEYSEHKDAAFCFICYLFRSANLGQFVDDIFTKTLILKENPSARYVHCFAHRIQLVVVAVSKSIQKVSDFFSYVGLIVNMTASSCKRMDSLRQNEHDRVLKMLESGELTSGKGQHQATSLARPGDTRWGSHYITLFRLQSMRPSIIGVLDNVFMDGLTDQRGMAESLLEKMEHYTFVFVMHLMIRVLEITNILSRALQDKDQNMLQAFSMIETTKAQLQRFRETGWESLLQVVERFCIKNSIAIVNMDDTIHSRSRRLRDGDAVTYYKFYRVEVFCPVLDSLIMEMKNRFPETSTEILLSIACLDPSNSFARFNSAKLVRLAKLYPKDFSPIELSQLPTELEAYYLNMKAGANFDDIHKSSRSLYGHD